MRRVLSVGLLRRHHPWRRTSCRAPGYQRIAIGKFWNGSLSALRPCAHYSEVFDFGSGHMGCFFSLGPVPSLSSTRVIYLPGCLCCSPDGDLSRLLTDLCSQQSECLVSSHASAQTTWTTKTSYILRHSFCSFLGVFCFVSLLLILAQVLLQQNPALKTLTLAFKPLHLLVTAVVALQVEAHTPSYSIWADIMTAGSTTSSLEPSCRETTRVADPKPFISVFNNASR